jgi:hypothetical protein
MTRQKFVAIFFFILISFSLLYHINWNAESVNVSKNNPLYFSEDINIGKLTAEDEAIIYVTKNIIINIEEIETEGVLRIKPNNDVTLMINITKMSNADLSIETEKYTSPMPTVYVNIIQMIPNSTVSSSNVDLHVINGSK